MLLPLGIAFVGTAPDLLFWACRSSLALSPASWHRD
jgi:hypothetical protein